MSDLITMMSAAAGAGGEEADPNFNQTVLLLHSDGTNGAQNNTFLDSSTNNFTITRNGNTTQGTFSPFSVAAGEWSNYFNGTTDYLTFPTVANNNFDFGAGTDFTVEAWIYPISGRTSILGTSGNQGGTGGFLLSTSPTNYYLRFFSFVSTAVIADGTTSVPFNQWSHVAVTREGTTLRLFLNGVLEATATNNESFNPNSGNGSIGSQTTIQSFFSNGYTSNVRVVKGTAVYTAAFTPPTTPLTAISGTELLTCQSNRFIDNSSNAFAITVNGTPSVQPFSPFAPSAAYSPSVNGGSGYFDGTSDYLQAASNVDFQFGTGEFVIEGWYYFTGASANYTPLFSNGTYDDGVMVRFGTNSDLYINGTQTTWTGTTGTFPFNSWNHVCLVRTSTTVSLFINGTRVLTTTDGANISPTSAFTICDQTHSLGSGFTGYVSNFRTIKGNDGPYNATLTTITVPTTLLTAVSGTELLLNFTNAGIFDNTGKNNLETVGNAQIDTTTKKYGTGSMEFDGTGDWLKVPNSPNLQLGTGNFTIEFWVYLASGDTGSARGLVAKGGASTGWLVSLDSSEKVVFTYTTSTITSSGAITTNAWNHIAVVREGTGSNETKIYIGGTNDGTGTVSTDFNQTEVMYIGANRAAGDPMKGFIDDLRITKGVARYTATFTPPTKAFPDL